MGFTMDAVPDGIMPASLCAVDGCENPVRAATGPGRKPSKCEDHSLKVAGSKRAPASTGPSKVAVQAAKVLVSYGNLGGVGFYFAGMPNTSHALGTAVAASEESLAQVLDSDPALCRMLIGAGGKSAYLGLTVVLGQVLAAVVPVAYMEYKSKMEAKNESAQDRTTGDAFAE